VLRRYRPAFADAVKAVRSAPMAASQFIFFLIWLLAALAAAVALYVVWHKLYARFAAGPS
jgi:cell division septal protein FtsQ